MQSINGVEFNAERPTAGAHSKKSQQNTPPGTDINPITRLGINGFQMQLNVVEEHLDKYDELVAEFMKQQELILILRDGWEYHVEALGVQFPDMVIEKGEKYRFTVPLISETPYQFSVDEKIVTEAITTNNHEWDTGDAGETISTTGTVGAVPDIEITGGAVGATYDRTAGYTVPGQHAAEASTKSATYLLVDTFTFSAVANTKHVISSGAFEIKTQSAGIVARGKLTIQGASIYGGIETDIWEQTTNSTTYVEFSTTLNEIGGANEDLVVRVYQRSDGGGTWWAYMQNILVTTESLKKIVCNSPLIHNIADTSIVATIANEIEPTMVMRSNVDGGGTVAYSDDFTTTKYIDAHWNASGLTHDAGNDELDIADDGWIAYKIDIKFPIIGIPVLTSHINITSGTPTIQISTDGTTWYDIDTSIVDNVDTEYELDNATSLSFDGETVIYFRIDCAGAGANTGSIISFAFAANRATIDAQIPEINAGELNTFKCVQDASSSMDCTVELIFNHRKWVA